MYEIGQMVIYGTDGVCTVDSLQEMKVGGKKEKYIVLKPIYREGATIFVPMDNQRLLGKIRPLLTVQEIETLLGGVQEESIVWIEDMNMRKLEYTRILQSGDRQQVVRLIRTLYLRRQTLHAAGRHLRTADDQLLRDAEKLVNDEFSLVLNISRQDVPEYIRSRVEKSA